MTRTEAARLARQLLSEIAWDFASDPKLRDYVTADDDTERLADAFRMLASKLED